jgi:excisionase family DNA binding protein
MHDQGSPDGFAVPAVEPDGTVRPEWVDIATAAVNAVINSQNPADVDKARAAGPDSPYRVAEIAAALSVSKSTVYKAVESGALAGFRFGNTRKGTIRIPHGALVDYVAASAAAAVTRPSGTRQHSIVVDVRNTPGTVRAGAA